MKFTAVLIALASTGTVVTAAPALQERQMPWGSITIAYYELPNCQGAKLGSWPFFPGNCYRSNLDGINPVSSQLAVNTLKAGRVGLSSSSDCSGTAAIVALSTPVKTCYDFVVKSGGLP